MYSFRLFSLFILTFTTLFSQTYFYQRYGINNGLPSDEVYSIYKDSKDYLWVGTNAGIARYNGTEFKSYNSSTGLAGDRIWAISEDSKRNLFFGCYGNGISILNDSGFKNFNSKNGLVNNNVRALYYSQESDLMFIGTSDGLSVFDGRTFQNYSKENGSLKETAMFNAFIEKNDTVFCFTYTGYNFYYYLLKQRKLKLLPHTHRFYKYNSRTCAALDSPLGTIIGIERSGIKVLKNNETKAINNMGQVFGLAVDNRNQVWAAAWSYFDMKEPGGLFLYDDKKLRNVAQELGINSRFGWAIFYDKSSGIIWYGTNDQGLYKIQESPIKYYTASFFKSKSLEVNSIFADKQNEIWIGTNDKIFRLKDIEFKKIERRAFDVEYKKWYIKNYNDQYTFLNDSNGTFEKYESLRKQGKYRYPNPYRYLRSGKYLYHTLNGTAWNPRPKEEFGGFMGFGYDHNQNLMILCANGIYAINKDDNPELFIPVNYSSSRPNFIFDRQNNLHVVGWGWLTISHNSEKHKDIFQPDFKKEPSPYDICQMQTRDNEVWYAGMYNGLYCCINDSFQNFNNSNSGISDILNGLAIDKTNKIIIGGNNGHIYITDYKNKKLTVMFDLSRKDGILGSTINWLIIDSKNNLWFGTNKGLNQLDLNKLYRSRKAIIRNYNQEEGFNDYSGKIATIDSNDEIWIAGKNQIVRINTQELQNIYADKSKIRLSGLDVNFEPVPILTSLKFPYQMNTLTFYLEKQNYINPDKDFFRYRINKGNSSWSKFSNEKKFTLNKLAPGSYKINVESINTSNPSNISVLNFNLIIKPPIWKTWWFISTLIIILLSGAYFAYRFRIRRLTEYNQAQLEIQRKIHDLEMQALQAQMNPHFTFNALNSVQYYILDKDIDSALSFLNDFAKLIRLTLNSASQKSISLSEEIDYLKTYIKLEKKRLSDKFSEHFEVDSEIDPDETRIPPMLIQPFVENAVKHGLIHKKENGILKLSFKYLDEDSLLCNVEDNGIGRVRAGEISTKKPDHHNGKGTQITQSRIELFNIGQNKYCMNIIDLLDENSNSTGTRVELVIPILL